MEKLDFSFIVPVYNRPDEVEELLASLVHQTDKGFEVVIVEDGSALRSDEVVARYSDKLQVRYFYKKNEKPAIARNFGIERAQGNYLIFVDSDCIIPERYVETIRAELMSDYVDAFGGPDSSHPSFSHLQKAISYAMTSPLTTGGIRGGGEKVDKFYPRSFNMGFSRKVAEDLGGFPVITMHPGEDMVLAIEIIKRGYRTRLFSGAYVYHKRRASLGQFFRQVSRFAKVRVVMSKVYPETFKLFYTFPSLFVLGVILLLLLTLVSVWFLFPLGIFALLVMADSFIRNKSIHVALLSLPATLCQLFGYGTGFLHSAWCVHILGFDDYQVFEQGFYKKSPPRGEGLLKV